MRITGFAMITFIFILWIIFNGKLTFEIVLFGLGISACAFLFMKAAFGYTLRKEGKLLIVTPGLIWYFILLVFEIIKANLQTAFYVIFRGNKRIDSQIKKFRTELKSDFFRVLLSNSITLTPGTITVSLKDDELTVHCLDGSFATGVEESVFQRRLKRIERLWLR